MIFYNLLYIIIFIYALLYNVRNAYACYLMHNIHMSICTWEKEVPVV